MYNDELLLKCKHANFKEILSAKGYKYYDKGIYNLNIIGIRSKDDTVNEFNDVIVVEYSDGTDKCKLMYPATTKPGLKSLNAPVNSKGCAILVEGQYPSMFQKGLHQGKYDALTQLTPVKVYRDNNKDNKHDYTCNSIETGMFGINLHKAGENSIQVDGWSAGCQVIAKNVHFRTIMAVVEKALKLYPNKFTYTLINEKDLNHGN